MDEATRDSLFKMGNPYAKLSILDDEELATQAATAQLARAKRRNLNTHIDETQAYLFQLQNPYAKLSILPEEQLDFISSGPQQNIDFLWRTRSQVYHYVSEAFALPFVRTRPPVLLKAFGKKVIGLSPRAQNVLRRRIAAHLPDEHVVYNRLSPNELDRLLAKLLEFADDAAALDGQAD